MKSSAAKAAGGPLSELRAGDGYGVAGGGEAGAEEEFADPDAEDAAEELEGDVEDGVDGRRSCRGGRR